MTKVALYLRQSLDRTGEGLAVDRQREACQRLCEARGWTSVSEYVDNSVSASNGTRPAWTRMLRDAERGRFEIVLAWALDRITRSMKDTEQLVALCERTGVRVATVQGDLDLTTDQGRLVGRILSAVARGEVERKSERQRLANAQAAAMGKPPVGRRALGWEKDGITLVPRQADMVRRGFEMVLTGGSLRGVARLWNEAGLTTANGKPWAPYSVRGVLTNSRYAALRAIKGEVVGPGKWPAIVDEQTWRTVSGILGDNARRTTPTTARKYLLSGIALCGVCRDDVTTVNTGGTRHRVRTYKCSATRHLSRAAQPIDEFVTAVVLERLGRLDVGKLVAIHRPDVSELQLEAMTLRTRRDQLAEDYAAGDLSRSQLLAGSRRIDARLQQIEAQLADAAHVTVLGAFLNGGDVRAVWRSLDLDQQRAVLEALMTVTLLPAGRGARRFEPTTVHVAWTS